MSKKTKAAPLLLERDGDFHDATITAAAFDPDEVHGAAITDITGANFAGARFRCELARIVAKRCCFDRAVIGGRMRVDQGIGYLRLIESCDLRDSTFVETDLRNVRFEDCKLDGCDFSKAELAGASFVACSMRRTSFEGVDLENIALPDDVKTRLAGGKRTTTAVKQLAGVMATATSITFSVDFAKRNKRGEALRLSAIAPSAAERRRGILAALVLHAGDGKSYSPREMFQATEADVLGRLRALCGHPDVPQPPTFVRSTLQASGKGAPLKGPALVTAVAEALAQVGTFA